eukprot:TRINITY_DN9837_c0_g1_i2.p1 TRINITY_DN9837_c0_g1~~TRINITY_DN9837_c0_g1_i2.p1  ORF type:complete len:399 (+),score=35.88 TRINITY_DN9837_c0_g1_i2:60-1199(+)
MLQLSKWYTHHFVPKSLLPKICATYNTIQTCQTQSNGQHIIQADQTSDATNNTSSQVNNVLNIADPLDKKAAPIAPPIMLTDLEKLVKIIQENKRVVVLTGAGVSTESDIPDYRGPNGAYSTGFKPMTHQEFISSKSQRQRFWSRSYVGWNVFSNVRPNEAHIALARLQSLNWVQSVITQNVDGLHQKGGASNVIELHGSTREVICMDCGSISDRNEIQGKFSALNPTLAHFANEVSSGNGLIVRKRGQQVQLPIRRPDGHVEFVDAGDGLVIPSCVECASDKLKPKVVFFGDSVEKEVVEQAYREIEKCEALLVLGSSLMVYSAFRIVKKAFDQRKQIAVINVGETRADQITHFKVEARVGEVMSRIAHHPALQIPRI